MADDGIVLAAHSHTWAEKFESEARNLRRILAAWEPRIEHIGSTAVPGLEAKPIIDIAIRIDSIRRVPELVPALLARGYVYEGEYGLPGRHFFTRGIPREYHVHVVDSSTEHWDRWVIFRDFLREDERLREQYQALKRDLVKKYAMERPRYTAGKTSFIDGFVTAALQARRKPQG